MKKSTLTIIILIILALAGIALYYWYFFMNVPSTNTDITIEESGGFNPLNVNPISNTNSQQDNSTIEEITATTTEDTSVLMPKLRLLSQEPVAGVYASTTKDKTIIRFVDRGTGHIYEANDLSMNVEKISNTTLPKIYEAYWNKNLNALVLRYLKDNTDLITNFYAELRTVASSTASSTTPFEIKGKYLSYDTNQIAVSPTKDRIFTWNIENKKGIGYISSFDEKNKTKIVETPLNQMNVDWPETSTITITTKGSSLIPGYSYTVNTKTTEMRKILSNIRGLSVKMSVDGTKTLYSEGGNKISTKLLNNKDGISSDIIFNTLADKCVWSTLRKNEVYCAVPTEINSGFYPEDWYKGNVSFIDQIWILDTTTGEVHLLANLLNLSKTLIDATELTLDPKEEFLYFINKRDLSLWSLDLNQ